MAGTWRQPFRACGPYGPISTQYRCTYPFWVVADDDVPSLRPAGAGNHIGRAVDAFAVIEQHAQAAISVRDHDVQLAVASEIRQLNAVGLLRGSRWNSKQGF